MKLSPTEAEAKEMIKNNPWILLAQSEQGASDLNDGLLKDGNNDRGYNTFWIDPGVDFATVKGEIRTSWIVDPPDGRIPVSPAGQKARADAGAAKRATMYQGPETLPIAERCLIGFTGAGAMDGTRIAAGGLNNPTILDRFAAGLAFSQLLTDFGRTGALTESASLTAASRAHDTDARKADVLLQVDRAYFNALRAQAVLKVAEQTVAARQLAVDQVTALADSHLKSGLDVSFAPVNNLREALDDANVRARGLVMRDDLGREHIAPVVRFLHEPAEPSLREPALGEHNPLAAPKAPNT